MATPDLKSDWTTLKKHTITFSTLPSGFPLKVDILLPTTLTPSKSHPLIITYHGGGLSAGARDHYMFQASWLPSYAARSNAIIVDADYRLLPQVHAGEIIDDLHTLWSWVQSSLNKALSTLEPDHAVDLNRILVEGGSAGGFCAAHLALSFPEKIRAAIMVYPMVDGFDQRGAVKNDTYPASIFMTDEELQKAIEEEIAAGPKVVRLYSGSGPSFTGSLLCDQKAYWKAFGERQEWAPMGRVGEKRGKGLPERVWIVHGKDDTTVELRHTQGFVDKIRAQKWKGEVELTVVGDEPSEHGFDATWKISDEKLDRHLRWIDEVWLQ